MKVKQTYCQKLSRLCGVIAEEARRFKYCIK